MRKPLIPREIRIVYRRLPTDIREFPGLLRESTASKLVIQSPISVDRPIRVSGQIIADTGYLSIWFIYSGRWYDVGKFYDAAGRWLGYYCDILKPVKKLLATPSRTVTLTDLFLDLWIARDGRTFVLDEEELDSALEKHAISTTLAQEARKQVRRLAQMAKVRQFPPAEVRTVEPLAKKPVS
jgi:predicted RNA-binding protein associated with RNAse of E/G family